MILIPEQINSFLSTTFSGIRTSIQSDVSSANSAISSAISAINKVNPFGNISVPQLSVPSLDALQNVTLPTDFEDALNKLNASLPTVSDLKDKIDALYVPITFFLFKTHLMYTLQSRHAFRGSESGHQRHIRRPLLQLYRPSHPRAKHALLLRSIGHLRR